VDLRDYLRVLSRRWRVIAALTLLGTGLGVLATYTTTPEYRATTTLFVSMQYGADTTQLNQGNVFTQARVQSYAKMAASPLVARQVIRSLKLDMTPAQLARSISASAQPDTVLLRISVTDTSPRRAALISNTVAERFAGMVSELERPANASDSPVRLSVTEPASTPTAPVSPRPVVNLALGLLSGLALGAGCAVLRESLDTSVRTRDALADLMTKAGGPPVLGSIVHDSRNARHLVAARHDMHGLRAEGFRQLRTNLRFVDVDRVPKVIAVTSALPGEGKTSVAVNLAAAMAEAGGTVCLVETDLRRPSVARALGLVGDAGLTTCLIGQVHLQQVLQSTGTFTVLTSGAVPPNPAELLGSEQFRTVLATLAEQFDHIIIDTSPVLPDQVTAALDTLRRGGTPVLGTVLNMAPLKGGEGACGYAYAYQPQHPSTSGFARLLRQGRVTPAGPLALHGPSAVRPAGMETSRTVNPAGPMGDPHE
jgi:non-specific protein-tyrosine kinase